MMAASGGSRRSAFQFTRVSDKITKIPRGNSMSESLTLELPADVALQARAVASATNKRVEDIVVAWIGRGAAESPLEELPDAKIIELSESQLPEGDQTTLSDLLGRPGELSAEETVRLDELLATYRRGLVLKARATKEAVVRGLIPRLNGNGA
jgi:hypothetical protein